jgi:hypothetical protein
MNWSNIQTDPRVRLFVRQLVFYLLFSGSAILGNRKTGKKTKQKPSVVDISAAIDIVQLCTCTCTATAFAHI